MKLSKCLQPEAGHAQFDKGYNLKLTDGKHTLSLRYTKYMKALVSDVFASRSVTVIVRVDESSPSELKLMGVVKDE